MALFPIIKRESYFQFTVLILLFLLLVFDRDMAMIYILILVGDFLWYNFDKHVSYQIEKTADNRFSSLLQVGIAAVVFFTISKFALMAVGETSSLQATLGLLATSTPILAGNKILTFVGWALLIPIIETVFFFGTLLEGLATYAEARIHEHIDLYAINIKTIMLMVVIGALFALFHLTAKNLSSTPLMLTFIFAIISCILVILNKELKQAILLHCVINGMAVLSSYGIV